MVRAALFTDNWVFAVVLQKPTGNYALALTLLLILQFQFAGWVLFPGFGRKGLLFMLVQVITTFDKQNSQHNQIISIIFENRY